MASQRGLTRYQATVVRELLVSSRPSAVIHGACIGGDDEIDQIAAELGILRVVFPSDIIEKRVSSQVLRSRGPVIITRRRAR